MGEYEELKKMDEQIKNKAGKKTLLQRLKENRDSVRANKEHYKKLYREEFEKSKAKAIQSRAKQEAYDKYRPTRKQRIDSALSGFADLGLEAAGTSKTPRKVSNKRKQSKPKYVNIGGKAYPVAGSGKSKSKTRTKKTSKKDPFDIDFDFDFDF